MDGRKEERKKENNTVIVSLVTHPFPESMSCSGTSASLPSKVNDSPK